MFVVTWVGGCTVVVVVVVVVVVGVTCVLDVSSAITSALFGVVVDNKSIPVVLEKLSQIRLFKLRTFVVDSVCTGVFCPILFFLSFVDSEIIYPVAKPLRELNDIPLPPEWGL